MVYFVIHSFVAVSADRISIGSCLLLLLLLDVLEEVPSLAMLGGGDTGDVKKVASNSSSDNIVANSIDVVVETSKSLLETISCLFFFSSATAECSRVDAPSLASPLLLSLSFVVVVVVPEVEEEEDHDIHDDVAVEDDINKDVVRIVKAAECCMIAIVLLYVVCVTPVCVDQSVRVVFFYRLVVI